MIERLTMPQAPEPLKKSSVPNLGRPSVTVAICTRDRPRHLDECLRQLAKSDYRPFSIVVVDNAPSDRHSREVALRWGARYEVEETPGLTRARNRAARLSDSEIIAYLDDDALPDPDWLQEITAPFEDRHVMAVAGRVIPWSQAEDHRPASNVRGTSESGTVGGHEPAIFTQRTPSWFAATAFGAVGIGANMAFRRGAFALAPGFDERLGPGGVLYAGEEYQVWTELIRRGYAVVYTPAAVVRHPFAPDAGEDIRARYLKSNFGVGAYTVYLIAEYPDYAIDVLAYVLRRLLGGSSPRGDAKPERPIGVSAWSAAWAVLRGAMTYLQKGASAVPMRDRHPLLRK
jgi:GT2 family glycosyltransferase